MERTVWDLSRLYGAWREAAALNVVFQPLVHIPSGQAFGFEALSRPQLNRQSIPIGILLESASTVNQLSDFDRFALPAILNSASQLNYPEALRLFINFSPLTLLNPDFIFDAFRAPGIRIKPAQVVIEISERESIPEAIDLESLLMPYRDANMKIALDDFGAGYSGLNRLVSLQPDYAKIDLNLVRDIDKNAAKHALVESTVLFAGAFWTIATVGGRHRNPGRTRRPARVRHFAGTRPFAGTSQIAPQGQTAPDSARCPAAHPG